MICTQDHEQYLTNNNYLCLFVCNQGIKESITHYHDSIHNCEYHNFYYRIVLFSLSLSPSSYAVLHAVGTGQWENENVNCNS